MSEMLGNQYFIARNYWGAAEELEEALVSDPRNKMIRKKLIVCYNQTGKIRKALDVFQSLVRDDIDFIINTDPVEDDCPCGELVYDAEKLLSEDRQSVDTLLRLGMLWLFCDKKKSREYFEKALKAEQNSTAIKTVLTALSSHNGVKQE
ncbi:MAG: hypothetical protein GWP06_11115 [Actinobacteria bacterium]|nr:hypothetical protein [Actinomycetota bacterium]